MPSPFRPLEMADNKDQHAQARLMLSSWGLQQNPNRQSPQTSQTSQTTQTAQTAEAGLTSSGAAAAATLPSPWAESHQQLAALHEQQQRGFPQTWPSTASSQAAIPASAASPTLQAQAQPLWPWSAGVAAHEGWLAAAVAAAAKSKSSSPSSSATGLAPASASSTSLSSSSSSSSTSSSTPTLRSIQASTQGFTMPPVGPGANATPTFPAMLFQPGRRSSSTSSLQRQQHPHRASPELVNSAQMAAAMHALMPQHMPHHQPQREETALFREVTTHSGLFRGNSDGSAGQKGKNKSEEEEQDERVEDERSKNKDKDAGSVKNNDKNTNRGSQSGPAGFSSVRTGATPPYLDMNAVMAAHQQQLLLQQMHQQHQLQQIQQQHLQQIQQMHQQQQIQQQNQLSPTDSMGPATHGSPTSRREEDEQDPDDLLSKVDRAWFMNAEPEISDMADSLGQDDINGILPLKDAAWFLESLENYQMAKVSNSDRNAINESTLRSRVKHRAAILFHEDLDFIVHYHKRFQLDQNDPFCDRDPQRWIIHELSKILVENYQGSIRAKADRSCIWSALMARALFHLERSGFTQVHIANNHHANNEATLFVGDYHISRSNLTKLLKRHAGAPDAPDSMEP